MLPLWKTVHSVHMDAEFLAYLGVKSIYPMHRPMPNSYNRESARQGISTTLIFPTNKGNPLSSSKYNSVFTDYEQVISHLVT